MFGEILSFLLISVCFVYIRDLSYPRKHTAARISENQKKAIKKVYKQGTNICGLEK